MLELKDNFKIKDLIDKDTEFEYINENNKSNNFLNIPRYSDKLSKTIIETKRNNAVITGLGKINGTTCAICKLDYNFIAGTIGVIEGRKIADLIEIAGKYKYPLIFICQSGGIRLQEGIYALMQMGGIASAFAYWKSCIPVSISVLLDPCMGGTTASIGMMSDIILSVPNAKIGFTGYGVLSRPEIDKSELDYCQTSESQFKNGFIDKIVSIEDLRKTLVLLVDSSKVSKVDSLKIKEIPSCEDSGLSTIQKIKRIRSSERLDNKDYISKLFSNFVELHGDRLSGDDSSIYGGLATFNGIPVTVIGTTRGHTTEDIINNNFGMVSPSGYRKAIRLMKLSDKRPIIIFINTPGADPSVKAENKGQSKAIADCMVEMASINAPILTIITGEANSGGALALSISNDIWMLENAVYSVVSPEGFASLILKKQNRTKEAADLLRITAKDMLENHIINGIISEHNGSEQDMINDVSAVINNFIKSSYNRYPDDNKRDRQQKFSRF